MLSRCSGRPLPPPPSHNSPVTHRAAARPAPAPTAPHPPALPPRPSQKTRQRCRPTRPLTAPQAARHPHKGEAGAPRARTGPPFHRLRGRRARSTLREGCARSTLREGYPRAPLPTRSPPSPVALTGGAEGRGEAAAGTEPPAECRSPLRARPGEKEGTKPPLASRRTHYPASAAGGPSVSRPMGPRRARHPPIPVSAGGAGAGRPAGGSEAVLQ